MSSNSIYPTGRHYVYRITNTVENKHYYGVRSSKKSITPQEDLGFRYFSSSSDKIFLNDQKENPMNYRYKVIRVCESRKQAEELEIILHEKFDVAKNPAFYNRSKHTSTGFSTKGRPQTEDAKVKLSRAHKGKTLTEEHKAKMSKAKIRKTHSQETKEKIRNANIGKKMSEESKQKMSKAKIGISPWNKGKSLGYTVKNKGKKHSQESKQKMSDKKIKEKNPFYGKTHSPETLAKMSAARKEYWSKRRSEETSMK